MGRINKLRKKKLARWMMWHNGRKILKTTVTFYFGDVPLIWHGGAIGTSGRIMFEGKVIGFGTVKKNRKRKISFMKTDYILVL